MIESPERVNPKKVQFYLEKAGWSLPTSVRKRDGSIATFDLRRIERAVQKCFDSVEEKPQSSAAQVATTVAWTLGVRYSGEVPSVEQIQDIVETTLLTMAEYAAAKSYILYRDHHQREREIPVEVRDAFDEDDQYFPSSLQKFQFYDKYSRYNWDKGRRETWVETVDRVIDYFRFLVDGKLDESVFQRLRENILRMRVMPSMRALAMAGDAAKRNSLAIYNCSYLPVSEIQSFVEALLISMAGCGTGFSVESEYVEQLPRIKRQKKNYSPDTWFVEDSTEGWAAALQEGLTRWFNGEDVKFDFSFVRPAGAPLKVKGGRASGPEPLRASLAAIRGRILSRQGSYLRPLDCLDIMCWVGDAAVSGGVRRTAMICLFDWWDNEVRNAKNGVNLVGNEQRWNSNNSAVWPEELSTTDVMEQMLDMAKGNRGEPGIFSRENANRTKPKRRKKGHFGTNPCGEINLRPQGLCNLSIAVARSNDTVESLKEKVELATIIGTIQSLATNFPGMRPEWEQNCIDERLLGVDITGQMDCPVIQSGEVMEELKAHAIATNAYYAELLDINPSAAITCNKPSGNSSQLLDCSSGLHARWAPYYLRRVRVSAHTPLYRVLRDAGVPMDPENGQSTVNATTWVVSFPVKSPEGSITRQGRSAIEQCEYWLLNKTYWTEHNPSCTVTYQPDELISLTQWVWDHRQQIGGLSFLPADDAEYSLMPYEEISEEEYLRSAAEFPDVDFARLYLYEAEDMTTASQELACMAGNCDI